MSSGGQSSDYPVESPPFLFQTAASAPAGGTSETLDRVTLKKCFNPIKGTTKQNFQAERTP